MSAAAAGAAKGSPSSQVSKSSSQKHWARKHRQLNKYAHQHSADPKWFKHAKHVLICSWSGRPIYTRFGDETKLAGYLGVLTAFISNFQRMGDQIRSIVAGRHVVQFKLIGPFYLFAISRTGEPPALLEAQLALAHSQIVSVLTGSVARVLEDSPQYDIRNLMGGTENLLTDLLDECDNSPCFLLDSVQCLRMSRSARSRIGTVLRPGNAHKANSKSLLYSVLMCGGRVVNMFKHKDKPMHNSDLLLLINTVTNSQSLRSSESWTPICLPKFSDKGYLYAYVCYIAADVSLTLITGAADDFHLMQAAKVRILEGLQRNDSLGDIRDAVEHPNSDVRVEEVDAEAWPLLHFIYKSEPLSQIVSSAIEAPYNSKKMQKNLFRRYQRCFCRLVDGGHQFYYQVAEDVTVLAWTRPGDFTLLAAFTPLATKDAALAAASRIVRWAKREDSLFFLP